MFDQPDVGVLDQYNLTPGEYDMLIARIFPENSIEMILDGVVRSGRKRTLLVIGGYETEYGQAPEK